MSDIFFSVVIATYNRAALLRYAIQSVLDQEFVDFEVLVVDDGSTDDTQQMVLSLRDKRIHYSKIVNSERGAARNIGILRSRGRYITFLDSDDYLLPQHLKVVHRQIIALRFPEIYHQAYVIMNDKGKILQRSLPNVDLGQALFRKGNVMSCMGVFVRCDISKKNLFHEDRALAGLEDWELWIRLAEQFRIHYGPEPTGVLLQHEGRNTVQVDFRKLEKTCWLFLELVIGGVDRNGRYGTFLKSLKANVFTYLSLHLSMGSMRKESLGFLVKGIIEDQSQLFRRRTLAILRNIIFRRPGTSIFEPRT